MTEPFGYCDPNGDGDFGDADWVKGWHEYQDKCSGGEPPPPAPPPQGCECLTNVDNYCLYPKGQPGCTMTEPFGYCDPNGDGSYGDADWEKGWYEYQANCT